MPAENLVQRGFLCTQKTEKRFKQDVTCREIDRSNAKTRNAPDCFRARSYLKETVYTKWRRVMRCDLYAPPPLWYPEAFILNMGEITRQLRPCCAAIPPTLNSGFAHVDLRSAQDNWHPIPIAIPYACAWEAVCSCKRRAYAVPESAPFG